MRPVLIDLYCKQGGATRGYQNAGFYVIGVDKDPQPRYVGDEFIQGDVLEIFYDLPPADAYHASPPCQAYVGFLPTQAGKEYPELIETTRNLLETTGKPFVIENVEGAPLINPLMLCGSMFGLSLIRHRLFECNPPIWFPPAPCQCSHLYTASNRGFSSFNNGATAITVAGHNFRVEDARTAMGIDWMNQDGLREAIPPAYTEFVGRHLMKAIKEMA